MAPRVALFVTCIVDQIFPDTGEAVVELLAAQGVQVDFPMAQTCCGQPGFNSGYQDESRAVARHFLKVFAAYDAIVTPSGSCAAMVRHFYPELFKDQPELALAQTVAAKTWEFTQYLVDVLHITRLGTSLPKPATAAIHDACHGLRGLGLGAQSRALLGQVGNLTLTPLAGNDQCCGFGGLFAVKMSEISGAMLKDKLLSIEAAGVDFIITGDASCLMHMNGGLSRQGSARRVVHIAEVLAGRV